MAVKGECTYRIAKSEIAFSKAEATEIKLGTTSINQYLTDLMSVSESASIHTNKLSVDGFGFTDAKATALEKSIVDSVGFTENVSVQLIVESILNESDSLSFADAHNTSFAKQVGEVFSVTEDFSYVMGTGHNSVLNSSALNTFTLNL